jgi:hypothetical protein
MPYADKQKDLEYHRQYNKVYDETTIYKRCVCCNQDYPRKNYATHLKTKKHLDNEAKYIVPKIILIEPLIENTNYKRCECCHHDYLKKNYSTHLKTNLHKINNINKIEEIYMMDLKKWNDKIKQLEVYFNFISSSYPKYTFVKGIFKFIKESIKIKGIGNKRN